jgi:hypothetical protein
MGNILITLSIQTFFFMGRSKVSARELWSSGAPLKHKIHMWLTLKDVRNRQVVFSGGQRPQHIVTCIGENMQETP